MDMLWYTKVGSIQFAPAPVTKMWSSDTSLIKLAEKCSRWLKLNTLAFMKRMSQCHTRGEKKADTFVTDTTELLGRRVAMNVFLHISAPCPSYFRVFIQPLWWPTAFFLHPPSSPSRRVPWTIMKTNNTKQLLHRSWIMRKPRYKGWVGVV